MSLPEPRPGLVINYSYLWIDERRRGAEEGRKDRPCAIVVASRRALDATVVTVIPITHTAPRDRTVGIELTPAVKRHLGLDDERSWIVLSETNDFLWPGPDLRPIGRERPARFAYGMLPPKLFVQIKAGLLELHRQRLLARVPRSE